MDSAAMTPNGTSPKVAVAGCGNWGKNLVHDFAELGALAAVCDPDPAVATSMATRYGVPFADWDALLADRSTSAVAIAAPAVRHAPMAEAALAAGKDVFVEKPLAVQLRDAAALVDLADRNERILMVGHLLHYHPAFLALKAKLEAGELGRLLYLYSNRLNFGKLRPEENVLWSFAPLDISMILALTRASPDWVEAQGAAFLTEGVADLVTLHMGFADGVRAQVQVSWLNPFKEQKLVVVGSEAMAVFDDRKPWREKLTLYRHTIDSSGECPIARPAEGEAIDLEEDNPLKRECERFVDAIRTRNAPPTDGAEGLRVLEVLAAAQAKLDRTVGG